MGLSAVTIPGATSANSPLLSKRQTNLATNRISNQINQSAVNSSIVVAPNSNAASTIGGGADTIFAGSSSLLISLGGVDTLGSGPAIIQFHSSRHAAFGQNASPLATLPGAAANISFAATGNLTLLGGVYVDPPSASLGPTDSLAGGAQAIATVFGAAMVGSVLVFDQGQTNALQPPHPVVSVAGAAPDLLLGWTFGVPGYTLNFAGGQNLGGSAGAHLRDGTDVRFASLPRQGAIEIVFPPTELNSRLKKG